MAIALIEYTTDFLFNISAIEKINQLVDVANNKGTDFLVSGSVTDGEYLTVMMPESLTYAELSYIKFLDGGGAQVTPSAGTYKLMGFDGNQFDEVSNSQGDFLLQASNAYNPERQRPSGVGRMTQAKIVTSGVTGAVSFEALVWRY